MARAHAQSLLGAVKPVTPKKEAEKKRSLRNEKLKANRTSETEEQRKERLRISREKYRARRRTRERKGRQTQTITRNNTWQLSKD